jgi:RNA polymerase sigma factor (sigma-70 family)
VNALNDQQLLQDYAERREETAFAELVRRYIDLVYSAALRMVRDAHLAEDVTQGVFVVLAGNARQLTHHPVLSGWLHCTARNLAAKTVRSDVRRRAREQEAALMNELLSKESEPSWETIAPHLDALLGELNDADRDALMLRYFEKKSAPEMAGILGISDEAAQKRVNRAVDRLRELFSKRNVTVGSGGLIVLISANAVQSAPIGLAAAITAAGLAGTTIATSTIIAATKTIAMTTLQKALITVTVAALAGAGIYEATKASQLRDKLQTLQQEQAPLAEQIRQLQKERDDATNRLAQMASAAVNVSATNRDQSEVLKLRGQVGTLRQQQKLAGEKSALSKVTANPEVRKLLHDQQKVALSAIYKDFAGQLKLSPDMAEKFNDLLADGVMDNVDLITQALHDHRSQADINQIFADENRQFQAKVQELLGDDALAQYKDYTQNLLTSLTVAQFEPMLTGDKQAKADKMNQLKQSMQQATMAALNNAGLPPDYQVVPMLNFANIASENQGSQSVDLLDSIYANVIASSSNFLTPDEIASFQTFRTNAINNNRAALSMNRTLMAPLSQ